MVVVAIRLHLIRSSQDHVFGSHLVAGRDGMAGAKIVLRDPLSSEHLSRIGEFRMIRVGLGSHTMN